MKREIIVQAFYDSEASVWVAEATNYPGIVTEGATHEELISKLRIIIPKIIQANNDIYIDDIPIRLLSEFTAIAKIGGECNA